MLPQRPDNIIVHLPLSLHARSAFPSLAHRYKILMDILRPDVMLAEKPHHHLEVR